MVHVVHVIYVVVWYERLRHRLITESELRLLEGMSIGFIRFFVEHGPSFRMSPIKIAIRTF